MKKKKKNRLGRPFVTNDCCELTASRPEVGSDGHTSPISLCRLYLNSLSLCWLSGPLLTPCYINYKQLCPASGGGGGTGTTQHILERHRISCRLKFWRSSKKPTPLPIKDGQFIRRCLIYPLPAAVETVRPSWNCCSFLSGRQLYTQEVGRTMSEKREDSSETTLKMKKEQRHTKPNVAILLLRWRSMLSMLPGSRHKREFECQTSAISGGSRRRRRDGGKFIIATCR